MSTFRELLHASYKSKDTEEWIDVHFNRPIGLVFAVLWNKLGVHPNTITFLSMLLGFASGWMFYYTDLYHNILGVLLLVVADICDSTDGQMARLSGKKTLLGRALDGFSGDVWFASIYFFIALRLMDQNIPGTSVHWGILIWVLVILAGFLCHSRQSSLADYYRQIHLFFLNGKSGSELDNSASEFAIRDSQPKEKLFARFFYTCYGKYCRSQEKRTPYFQRFFKQWKLYESSHSQDEVVSMRQQFLKGSRPLMKYTNLLTFNLRALVLYASCVLGSLTGDVIGPWIYPAFEIILLSILYIYMWKSHENLCKQLLNKISNND